MVNEKNKRKIQYNGTVYYWYVKVENSIHKVYIISEDKKVNLEYPFFDSELPITPQIIRKHLKEYEKSKKIV